MPKILQSANIKEIMLLHKNLTTNKELSDFYRLGIFFSRCYCLTTIPFLENMSMHFVSETFTSHCKQWPLRSALALLKDSNWVLMQVYNPTQIKGKSFSPTVQRIARII